MPITSTHPDYDKFSPMWMKADDCYDGEEAVKSQGEKYLPRLAGDDNKAYAAFMLRASFFPAFTRTVDGLLGAIFKVDPIVEGVDEPWLEDMTGTGMGAKAFAKLLTQKLAVSGKVGVLVDWDGDGKRPFATIYEPQDITNWGDDFVVLRETEITQDPTDRFRLKRVTIYRELRLVEGKLVVIIHRNGSSKGVGWTEEVVEPLRAGEALTEIPFYIVTPSGEDQKEERPPMMGLVNVNLAMYRTSADLENGRHRCGFPTPWIADDDIKAQMKETPGQSVRLGKGLFLLSTGGTCGFLEFTGQGLDALAKAMEEKKTEAASLGAAIFEKRDQVETAETARIHASAQNSLALNILLGAEEGMRKIFDLFFLWANRTGKAKVEFNRDLVDTTLDGPAMTALMGLWQGGAITQETLLYNIQKAKLLRPDVSIEQEIEGTDLESEKLQARTPAPLSLVGINTKGLPSSRPKQPGKPAAQAS